MATGLDAGTKRAAGGRPDPLDHWLAQERARGLEDHLPPDSAEAADRQLPSGWWILPLCVLSLSAWGALIWSLCAD